MEQFCALGQALAVFSESVEDVLKRQGAVTLTEKTGVNGAFAPSRL